jgi:hypothetical protein
MAVKSPMTPPVVTSRDLRIAHESMVACAAAKYKECHGDTWAPPYTLRADYERDAEELNRQPYCGRGQECNCTPRCQLPTSGAADGAQEPRGADRAVALGLGLANEQTLARRPPVNEAHQWRVASSLLVELQARIDTRNSDVLDRLEDIGEQGEGPRRTRRRRRRARRGGQVNTLRAKRLTGAKYA